MSTKESIRPQHCIAIIGMAGRFPGAENIDEFWRNLRAGKEGIRHFSDHELRWKDADLNDANFIKARGVIEGIEYFDAEFFGIPPRQAEILDPQHRIWLECVHEALEDAGLCGKTADTVVGVFAGARESTYVLNNLCIDRESQERLLATADPDAHQIFLNNDRDSVTARTSYLFDFTGPSVGVQSACSTSLVAVAQACWSLASYQSDVCIAGGVCITLPTLRGYYYQEDGIYSPDGHCRTFDARAQGTVFGDGVGVVVLKRLDDALQDGDRVDAIIRGWSVNNDGREKASFSAPSVNGQAEVIALAQTMAAVEPAQISYVEAHGTGTQVGDPIEVAGLSKAFFRQTNQRQFCGLGSVKTNIGHLDTAAGIAGLIKTVLALKNREIPPSLHFENPNPNIDFPNSPFYVVDKLKPWHGDKEPRMAGVSALGVGGTNCHVVLEQAEESEPTACGCERAVVLTLSAKTEQALTDLKSQYTQFLSQEESSQIADIAMTTNLRRKHYRWRFAAAARSSTEMIDKLDGNKSLQANIHESDSNAGVGFLFTGQGVQYAQMGRELYDAEPTFRQAFDRCDELLRPHIGASLRNILYPDNKADVLPGLNEYTQPALFGVEYALAELWRSWGIRPAWVMGHSLGEYVAACVSGVFSLEDSLRLVAERGRLMNTLTLTGRMVSVFADPERVIAAIESFNQSVSIAAVNGPKHVVISGPEEFLNTITKKFIEEDVLCRDLKTSHAFHSPLVEPILTSLGRFIEKLPAQSPRVKFISTLTGGIVTNELTTAEYWRKHSRETVRFMDGVTTMSKLGCKVFVEIGPETVLTRFGRDTLSDKAICWISSMRRNESNWQSLVSSVGELYVRGLNIDWLAFNGNRRCKPHRLPAYPFQRRRFWIDSGPDRAFDYISSIHRADRTVNPILGHQLRLPGSNEIRFETKYSKFSPNYLADHRLFDTLVVPGASHVAMLPQAAETIYEKGSCKFEEIVFLRPMYLDENSARSVQLVFSPESQDNHRTIQLLSATAEKTTPKDTAWSLHLTGRSQALSDIDAKKRGNTMDIKKIQNHASQILSGDEFYTSVWGNAAGTGKVFRWIDKIWKGDGVALAQTRIPEDANDKHYYRIHPGLIEAAFQVLHCCKTFETSETVTKGGVIYVPFSIAEFFCYPVDSEIGEIWCYATLRKFDVDNVFADLCLSDGGGRVIAKMVRLCLRKLTREKVTKRASKGPHVIELRDQTKTPNLEKTAAERRLGDLSASLIDAKAEERVPMLLMYFREQWKQVSGFSESEFKFDSCLLDLGFDSLMAVMLANRIKTALGVTLSLDALLSDLSIEALSAELYQLWLDKNEQA
ncbi:MAG: beta-ketoacyl synthase N-terminal-like domain-containing protein [Arenicellales bacterium]